MPDIPVSFTYAGKTYTGHLSPVIGAGASSVFHLMIDRRYYGQLFYTERNGWQFASNSNPEWSELAEEFARVVVAWYQ